MVDTSVFFNPVDNAVTGVSTLFQSDQIGAMCRVYDEHVPPASTNNRKIAIIGVKDDRVAIGNNGCGDAPDIIRKYLYGLRGKFDQLELYDLGNILPGHTISDSHFALANTVEQLVKKNIIPIIIGGGHDITYANYLGYGKLEQLVNLVTIDSDFNLGAMDDDINSMNFLSKIITHQPNHLFNYSNLGYQTYFAEPKAIDLMDKLYFDAYRLGLVRNNLMDAEPIIRNADIVSFDIGSVRKSEAPGNRHAGPNGFFGDEFCQMSWYAGMSDKVSSVGFYEYNPHFDDRETTAQLVAQAIWCFIEGVASRKNDFPHLNDNNYYRYRVFVGNSGHEIVFIKSMKTDRWWMEVPFPDSLKKYQRHHLVPCSYSDYQTACAEVMPDRWWQTYHKLV